ncbi:MAG: Protein-arginine kinase activator protein [Chlamydiae bacterium]|nr:Protein-arginine kinase activator protein [Chlamydiota bacterium]
MADRPVECGQCKKSVAVQYGEMVGHAITETDMCSECPVLLKKLHGSQPENAPTENSVAGAGLCCSSCRTTFEAVKMGNPVGCFECYNVFGDLLIGELMAQNKIPVRLRKGINLRRGQPIHIGKTPDKPLNIPSSNRLTALNEALNEALKTENYEEAAMLRDQINQIMEKKSDE